MIGFRLGNPAKAYVLCARDSHPRHDDGFAKFLEVNDAEFDLDVDGNRIAKVATEESNVEDNGWHGIRIRGDNRLPISDGVAILQRD